MSSWHTRAPVLVVLLAATAAAVLGQPLAAVEATADSLPLTFGLPQASCSLVLQGYGWGQPGVQYCSVSCTPDAVVSIALNTSTVSCLLKGVSVADAADCMWQGSRYMYGGHSAVLSFCGRYQVQLVAPTVQNLWLPPSADPSTGIAVLGFGGKVQASISQGQLGGNNGSALLLTGAAHLQLQNKTFVNDNTASEGAGVLVLDSSLNITNSTLSNNSADWGGAVAGIGNAALHVWNSRFEQNNASSRGGAVQVQDSAQLQVNLSTFRNNSAAGGGAVAGIGNATIQAWNSSFEQNTASGNGGAVYVRDSAQLQANLSTFRKNSAVWGGAVEGLGNAALQVWNSRFEQNNASYGGAVQVQDSAQLQVNLSTFRNNSAAGGGAVAGIGNAALQVWNSRFEQNNASYWGAVQVRDSAQLQVNLSTFRNNSAVWGGAVAGEGNALIQAWNSSFEQNNASSEGGAVYVRESAQLQVNWSTFLNNSAVGGGAVAGEGNALIQAWNSSFEQNNASSGGGAVYVQDSAQLQVNWSTFLNNSAVGGGAVAGLGNVTIQAWNSSFEQNNASSEGGAVYVQDSAQLQVNWLTFRNNSAANGGAVNGQNSVTIQAWNSSFEQNNASYGGAMHVKDSAQLQVNWSTFRNNSAALGGAVLGVGYATIQAWNSSFEQNNAMYGGAVNVIGSVHLQANLSTFRNNSAVWGGAVEGTGNVTVQAWNSSFEQNNAGSEGGAIAMVDTSELTVGGHSHLIHNTASNGGAVYVDGAAVLQLSMDSTISNNLATGMGGGLYMSSDNFNRSQVQSPAVQGNTAGVGGQNVAVRPQSLAMVDSGSFVTNFNNRAGAYLPAQINVTGSHDLPCGGLSVQAMLDQQWPVGVNKTGEDGVTTINIKVQVLPGAHNITFSLLDNSITIVAVATLVVRGCVPGEVSLSNDTCEACPTGRFSLNPSNSSCDACPANAVCPGRAAMVPLLGFWHSSATSIQMHKCSNPMACQGNRAALEWPAPTAMVSNCSSYIQTASTYANMQCTESYHGVLCGLCGAGYGESKPFVCKKCLPAATIIGLYAVSGLAMLGFMLLICHFNMADSNKAAAADSDQPQATDVLKQLVLYMQYMLILASMNVSWPVTVSGPLNVLAAAWSPASPQTLTVECLFSAGPVPMAIRKTLFYLCVPISLLVVLLLVQGGIARCRARCRSTHGSHLLDRLLGSTMVVVFVFIPSLVRTTFGLFACVFVDSPTTEPYCAAAVGRYWIFDMDQQCFQGYHARWAFGLGVPLLVVLCLVLPVAIAAFTLCNRSHLHTPAFRKHYGFLFGQYRASCCFWEAVVLVQTMLLVAAAVFGYTVGPAFQTLIMSALLVATLVLLTVVRPHYHRQTGNLAIQSIGCLLFTSLVAQSLSTNDVRQDDQQFVVYSTVIGAVVLAINLLFVLSVLCRLHKLNYFSQLRRLMYSTLQSTLHCLPFCYSKHQRASHVRNWAGRALRAFVSELWPKGRQSMELRS